MDGVILTRLDRTVRWRHAAGALVLSALATLGYAGGALADAQPAPQRQLELLRVVRQECGACHGLHLSGGLGPALTREALADKPIDSMAAANACTILLR